VIEAPPLSAGAAHDSATLLSPISPASDVGAAETVAGKKAIDGEL
jgi:hypothetical protein